MVIDQLNKPTGFTLWLTGLSGAGKSTLAQQLVAALTARGRAPEVLDGDVVRTHLSAGLGFSREDRDTNIRRIAFVAQLVTRQGGVVIVAAISPYRATRDEARHMIGRFVEVYVDCPLEELVRRDVKGLYAKALRGEIGNFTGVSDPYEAPAAPEVTVFTDRETVEESAARVLRYLEENGYIGSVVGDQRPVASVPVVRVPVATNGQVKRPDYQGAVRSGDPEGRGLWQGLGGPHGGRLVERQATPEAEAAWRDRHGELTAIRVGTREVCDLELLANGGFSPLEGFLGSSDYRATVHEGRLADGSVWPVPVVLGVSESEAVAVREGQDIALLDGNDTPVAILHLREKYLGEVRAEAREVYRTEDDAHPGVHALYARGAVLLGGPVTVLRRPVRPAAVAAYRLDPADARRTFAARGWHTVVAFQTRNPVHRAHEYLLKTALESVDGLLLHPLVGDTKDDDIPAEVRLRCYEVLVSRYFPADRVVLGVLPAAMRYAGPREAIFHALIRKNYGCTHFIVGRDHAGVGNYYGTYDAQQIFEQYSEAELGIRPVFFDHSFYCNLCASLATAKTCPHDAAHQVTLSGTKVRSLLAAGEALPPEFSRPEVARVLAEAARVQV
jgi:ATP sulfurylase/adenylyl-sulfate kinase